MSQYDFGVIDPFVVDGVQLADMLNNWRDAIYTMQRGPARPAFLVPGQMWVNDSGGATNWIVNVYFGPTVGDKALYRFNTTTGAIIQVGSLSFADPTDNTKTAVFDLSHIATGHSSNLIVPDQNGWMVLAGAAPPNDATQYLDGTGAYSKPKGTVLQIATFATGLYASGTTLMNADNTIPQSNEGDQFMSLSFTPLSNASKLLIDARGIFATNASSNNAIMALFKDADANALNSSINYMATGQGMVTATLRYEMASPGPAPITFKVRAGGNNSSIFSMNGNPAVGQFFGGTLTSGIMVTEHL
jgi:hypothetical protein